MLPLPPSGAVAVHRAWWILLCLVPCHPRVQSHPRVRRAALRWHSPAPLNHVDRPGAGAWRQDHVDSPDVSGTEVLPEQDTRIQEDVRPDTSHGDGDHERLAHYVAKSKIVHSMVTGTPVTPLCGNVCEPSRDP